MLSPEIYEALLWVDGQSELEDCQSCTDGSYARRVMESATDCAFTESDIVALGEWLREIRPVEPYVWTYTLRVTVHDTSLVKEGFDPAEMYGDPWSTLEYIVESLAATVEDEVELELTKVESPDKERLGRERGSTMTILREVANARKSKRP